MTDPILRLEPNTVSVEPGGQATVVLTVTNPSSVVQGYSIDVVSTIALPWVQANPPTLSVYPQQEGTAVVTFAPPSGAGAPGGALPFGVRVWSQIEGGGSAVAEGDLHVGSVAGLQAKLTPIASSGRWSGRHTLKISNWGNSPARLRITPEDPGRELGFLVSPPVVDIPLGGEVTARLKVRTRHPQLRGAMTRLPFQVVCEPEVTAAAGPAPVGSTPSRPVVDGAFNQKPILSRLVVAVVGLALLAGIGGAALALRGDGQEAVSSDEVTNPPSPTGLTVVDLASPTKLTLVWDEQKNVDGFRLVLVHPGTDAREAPKDVGDATTVTVELEPETEMCFRLLAYRGDKPSTPTERVCGTTDSADTVEESSGPEPSVTITPSITPSQQPSTVDPDSAPAEFVSVLAAASGDDLGELSMRDLQLMYAALGIDAKVLNTDDYVLQVIATATLTPDASTSAPSPTGTPTPTTLDPLWIVYVEGDDVFAALGSCEAATATLTDAGETPDALACGTNYRVLGLAPGFSASPTPTA